MVHTTGRVGTARAGRDATSPSCPHVEVITVGPSRFRPPTRRTLRPPEETLGLSRRDFLKLGGMVLAAGSLSGVSLTTLTSCAAISERPIRREVNSIDAGPDINTYKAAVAAMKALPSTDPRNWANQAQIHYDHCQHGNWFFFTWHRAYLYYFEQICRQLTGSATFALPYWNWTLDPHVPAPFWDTSSSLYDGTRTATSSSTVNSIYVGSSVMTTILGNPNFLTFAGSGTGPGTVEATPHNHVHGFVGGDMGAYHSPLDPVFWTHHCRADELWVEWNILRNNPNTNDGTWANMEFTDFVDGHGNSVTVSTLALVLMPLLSYQYDTQV